MTNSGDQLIIDARTRFGPYAPAVAGSWIAISVVLFVLQTLIVRAAAGAEGGTLNHALPYPVVDAAFAPPQWAHAALLIVAALQVLALLGLRLAQRGRPIAGAERAAVVAGAIAMAAAAIFAGGLTSLDVYAYAGYAKLGLAHAYAPEAHAIGGAFAPVSSAWGDPMTPSFYGPLWVGFSSLVAGGVATLGGAVLAFRLVELAALMAIVAALMARRWDASLVALVALNPALYGMYVLNGHNDLFAAALLIAALACARRYPPIAAVLVAAAGLVKLPLAAFALAIFAGRGALGRRTAFVALAVVLTLLGSWLFGGDAYVGDLLYRLHTGGAADSGWHAAAAKALRLTLAAAAISTLLAAFVRGVVWRSGSWTMIALSSFVYPWYLAWSVAYASAARRAAVEALIVLPLVAALLETAFPAMGLGQLTLAAMLLYVAFEAIRARTRALDVENGAVGDSAAVVPSL